MPMKTRILFVLLFIAPLIPVKVQGQRLSHTINSDWKFHRGEVAGLPTVPAQVAWEDVSIPHTWNTRDVVDDEKGYYRGTSWYRKKLQLPASLKDKRIFLHFEAANQDTEVFVNGKSVGTHQGGYTAFTFPISDFLNFPAREGEAGVNEILVRVDNSFNEDIPTLTADFTFFGGIYRDVFLIAVPELHFNLLDHGSKGVFISTPEVSESRAEVRVKSQLVNEGEGRRTLTLVNTIRDAEQRVVERREKRVRLMAGETREVLQSLEVSTPKLWSPDHPYLYQVTTSIQENGQVLDELVNPLGMRWFEFDADKGFFLNGKYLKLIGTNRHQDFKGLGNALPDELHRRDVELLKEMGGNFLRVAHYPHDPTVLETCDRLGILTAVEIPIVNRITESEGFAKNAKNMQREMIKQGHNHPSTIIWAYMNEVLLRPKFEDDKERQDLYYENIAKLAQELEDITRAEDPYRYTMIPNHGHMDRYERVGLTAIPMIVGWNLYQGWYSAGLEKFAQNLDRHKARFPDKPVIVTEFGADADPRLRSFDPLRFDMTVEYGNRYHQVYLDAIMQRDFVAGATVWNLADFQSETRHDVVPHVNNKGLLGLDRIPKDTYHYYQANLLKEPFIRIASRQWTHRIGVAAADAHQAVQPLEVFTNLEGARLLVNGQDLGRKRAENRIIRWEVPFKDGRNTLEVIGEVGGKRYKDYMEVDFELLPHLLSDKDNFKDLAINLGTRERIFVDGLTAQVWMHDQPYRKGSWGHIGGEIYTMDNVSRTSYGTDQNILGTDMDPVYQTQWVGIEQYRVDVPDGVYDLILHLAELETPEQAEVLAYNLASEEELGERGPKDAPSRVFSVSANGTPVFSKLDMAEAFGPLRAISRKVRLKVSGGEGITLDFDADMGKAVLNGLEVRRIF